MDSGKRTMFSINRLSAHQFTLIYFDEVGIAWEWRDVTTSREAEKVLIRDVLEGTFIQVLGEVREL
jgi:hypothetical protein